MIKNKIVIIYFLYLLMPFVSNAQKEKEVIQQHIEVLAGPSYHGRGYVSGGLDSAASYIAGVFRSRGVLPLSQNGSYFQQYQFPVNTLPGVMKVEVDGQLLRPGVDYLVHAASAPWHAGQPQKIKRIKLAKVNDSLDWDNVKNDFEVGGVYLLQDADTPTKYQKLGIRKFATELPRGLYIVPKHGKLTWTASTAQVPGTIIYIEDTVINERPKKVLVDIDAEYIDSFKAKNVVGYVKGVDEPDSFIVFTAHFDHLGRMGKDALFAGASDNASGTSLVMYLAEYFAKHPQRYSVAFMLFSGEEAGLLGSEYYADNPLFPLEQIRFLINLDMTGDAAKGITVVNGVSHEPEFALLEELNGDSTYVNTIKKRERTSNSDHYHFAKKGVPAVFIYSMGNNSHYHDVFDLPKDITLDKVDKLARLLIKFTGRVSGGGHY